MSLRIFSLAAEQIASTWDDYAEHIERFADVTGEIDPEDVREACERGTMQLWGLQDDARIYGLAATEIVRTARGPVCVIRIASGRARVAMQERLLDEIGKWAKHAQGCKRVRIFGRHGWLRRFPRFHMTGVIAEWDLED